MTRRPLPWEGWSLKAVVLRFLMAALFGLVADVIIAFMAMGLAAFAGRLAGYPLFSERFWTALGWTLVGFPVVCGALGVFFFERMTRFTEE